MGLDGDELVVVQAYADEGPTLKRWKPRARGRVNRIRKRTCHVTLVLAEPAAEESPRRARKAETAASEAAPEKPKRSRKKAATPDKETEGAAA